MDPAAGAGTRCALRVAPRRSWSNVATFEHDRALIRLLHPREEPRQCRLPQAGSPTRPKLSRGTAQTDAADGLHILVTENVWRSLLRYVFRDILDLQVGRSRSW